MSLKPENFKKYEEDRNDPGSEWYWFFQVRYDGRLVYVKFKLLFIEEDFAFIKSLHIDDYKD